MGVPGCPIERTAAVLTGKWTTLIVRDLLEGSRRFGELRASLSGISPKTLSDRLRSLEEQGILTRHYFAEMPPRVQYQLTKRGRSLEPILDAMRAWGAAHAAR